MFLYLLISSLIEQPCLDPYQDQHDLRHDEVMPLFQEE